MMYRLDASALRCRAWLPHPSQVGPWAALFLLLTVGQAMADLPGEDGEYPPIDSGGSTPLRVPAAGYPLADFRTVDWAARIDSTWGASPMTTGELLNLFEAFWDEADRRFACFQDLAVDWDALHDRYYPEIGAGVSRGRFTAIMNHLSIALQESHTSAYDTEVNQSTPLLPGVPLLVGGVYGDNGHFGAGLTPLPDSSLLVYAAAPNHPLGLVPGDLVLGYDGAPWKDLYPQFLRSELPIRWGRCGSTPSSIRHCWMVSAGMNWHLFQTIDVVKYATGDTLHLSLEPMAGAQMSLICGEQMDVAGVPKPDLAHNDVVSWGIVAGTDIGYIYLNKQRYDFEQQFYNAVDSLMNVYNTSGMIIDFRFNPGGTLDYYYPAFELLFNQDVSTVEFGYRCDPSEHELLCPSPAHSASRFVIHGDPGSYYAKPIAVLLGPGAASGGDFGPLMLTLHPMVRVFGRPSCGAFNIPYSIEPPPPAPWSVRYSQFEAGLVSDPSRHLTHDEFPVDEEVWLTRDAVAQGVDSVVEAAIQWIRGTSGADRIPPLALADPLTNSPNPFTAEATVRFRLPFSNEISLGIYSVDGRLVRCLRQPMRAPAGDGAVVWDGCDGRGRAIAAGVYLARLQGAGVSMTRRVVVAR